MHESEDVEKAIRYFLAELLDGEKRKMKGLVAEAARIKLLLEEAWRAMEDVDADELEKIPAAWTESGSGIVFKIGEKFLGWISEKLTEWGTVVAVSPPVAPVVYRVARLYMEDGLYPFAIAMPTGVWKYLLFLVKTASPAKAAFIAMQVVVESAPWIYAGSVTLRVFEPPRGEELALDLEGPICLTPRGIVLKKTPGCIELEPKGSMSLLKNFPEGGNILSLLRRSGGEKR